MCLARVSSRPELSPSLITSGAKGMEKESWTFYFKAVLDGEYLPRQGSKVGMQNLFSMRNFPKISMQGLDPLGGDGPVSLHGWPAGTSDLAVHLIWLMSNLLVALLNQLLIRKIKPQHGVSNWETF